MQHPLHLGNVVGFDPLSAKVDERHSTGRHHRRCHQAVVDAKHAAYIGYQVSTDPVRANRTRFRMGMEEPIVGEHESQIRPHRALVTCRRVRNAVKFRLRGGLQPTVCLFACTEEDGIS